MKILFIIVFNCSTIFVACNQQVDNRAPIPRQLTEEEKQQMKRYWDSIDPFDTMKVVFSEDCSEYIGMPESTIYENIIDSSLSSEEKQRYYGKLYGLCVSLTIDLQGNVKNVILIESSDERVVKLSVASKKKLIELICNKLKFVVPDCTVKYYDKDIYNHEIRFKNNFLLTKMKFHALKKLNK